MFHPVGSQPSSVYWRRRLAFAATLVVVLVLIVVTVKVVFGGSGGAAPPQGQGSGSTSPAPRTSSSPSPKTSTSSSSTPPRTSTSRSSSSTSTAAAACDPKDLAVQAVTDKSSYQVGATPHLMLQVTNTGSAPCVQDLADGQVELSVYNGESRVWGSHDCKVLPGKNEMTLNADAPVRVTVVWSGLSSKDNDAHTTAACGPRQAVGAGTYTLYAKLGAKTGKAAQFSIG